MGCVGKRKKLVGCWLTEGEYADLVARARQAGLNQSDFLRARCGIEVTGVKNPKPIALKAADEVDNDDDPFGDGA